MSVLPIRLMAKNRGIGICGSWRTKRLRKKLEKQFDELCVFFWTGIRKRKLAEGFQLKDNDKVLGKYWKHANEKKIIRKYERIIHKALKGKKPEWP